MPDLLGKILFPRAAPDERRRKMQVVQVVLLMGVLIAAAVALMLWSMYQKARP